MAPVPDGSENGNFPEGAGGISKTLRAICLILREQPLSRTPRLKESRSMASGGAVFSVEAHGEWAEERNNSFRS
ncbi:MAG TPA: hypothetical protein PK024_12535 [Methanospirillum sp.]|uniref:hypothetical protein n=1 Tax=Methanospirillum sp. TaxID=45200 RepID=UPI002BA1361A|nr:hypothetical protein [Methanospirillum sp.]HOJ97651.1 hypothetical protein [Methanospirillum sp.]